MGTSHSSAARPRSQRHRVPETPASSRGHTACLGLTYRSYSMASEDSADAWGPLICPRTATELTKLAQQFFKPAQTLSSSVPSSAGSMPKASEPAASAPSATKAKDAVSAAPSCNETAKCSASGHLSTCRGCIPLELQVQHANASESNREPCPSDGRRISDESRASPAAPAHLWPPPRGRPPVTAAALAPASAVRLASGALGRKPAGRSRRTPPKAKVVHRTKSRT